MTIPQDKLDTWRKLAEAATPGPWKQYANGTQIYSGAGLFITAAQSNNAVKDAVFIAVAREAIPVLIDALEKAEADWDAYKRACMRAGVCMSCAISPPEPYGCTDCLNTGWDQGAPVETQIAIAERDAATGRADALAGEVESLRNKYDHLRGFIIRCATDEKPTVTPKEWLNAILFHPQVQEFSRTPEPTKE